MVTSRAASWATHQPGHVGGSSRHCPRLQRPFVQERRPRPPREGTPGSRTRRLPGARVHDGISVGRSRRTSVERLHRHTSPSGPGRGGAGEPCTARIGHPHQYARAPVERQGAARRALPSCWRLGDVGSHCRRRPGRHRLRNPLPGIPGRGAWARPAGPHTPMTRNLTASMTVWATTAASTPNRVISSVSGNPKRTPSTRVWASRSANEDACTAAWGTTMTR